MSGPTKRHIALCAALLMLGTGAPQIVLAGQAIEKSKVAISKPEASKAETLKPTAAQGSSERTPFTADEIADARPEGLPTSVRIAGDDAKAFQALVDGAGKAGDPWLVLSGGGENGAFAAGLLTGWSQAGDRPAFGVVTGVSTGALIAPFAFVGPMADGALRRNYTEISAADVFEFGATSESLTDTWPLQERIERAVTPALLKAVAAEHAKGRRLLVATTQVDAERPVLWDMGAIATQDGERALRLFREIVLASSAVPGVFPPVMVEAQARNGKTYQEMHDDGGAMGPFYLGPAAAMTAEAELHLPTHRVYLVINNRLTPEFQMATRSTLSVLGRSMSAAIKAQTSAALALAKGFAARSELDLRIAEIDGRFTQTAAAPFDRSYMKALFAHGEALGRAGTAFGEETGRSANAPSAKDLAAR